MADWLIRLAVAAIRRYGISWWGKTRQIGGLAVPRARRPTTAALPVASFFVLSSLGGSVVLDTTSVRTLPSMLFPAAERAVQISAASITGMSEKADPAVATAYQAPAQCGMVPQNRPQRDLILANKRPGPTLAVPVGTKFVNFFQAYDKKARFCVIMRIVFTMSSSYRLDVKLSRGRARIFCAR